MSDNSRRRAVSSRVGSQSKRMQSFNDQSNNLRHSITSITELIPELTLQIFQSRQELKEKFNQQLRAHCILFDKIFQQADILYYTPNVVSQSNVKNELPNQFHSLYWKISCKLLRQKCGYLEDCIAKSVNNAIENGKRQQQYYLDKLNIFQQKQAQLKQKLQEKTNSLFKIQQEKTNLQIKILDLNNFLKIQKKKSEVAIALKDIELDHLKQLEQSICTPNKSQKQILKVFKQIQKELKIVQTKLNNSICEVMIGLKVQVFQLKQEINNMRDRVEKQIKSIYQNQYSTALQQKNQIINQMKYDKLFKKQQIKQLVKYSAQLNMGLQELQQQCRNLQERIQRNHSRQKRIGKSQSLQSCYITKYYDTQNNQQSIVHSQSMFFINNPQNSRNQSD